MIEISQKEQIQSLVHSLQPNALLWLNGYVEGLINAGSKNTKQQQLKTITILYGTQTGNAKKVAEQLVKDLSVHKNLELSLVDADHFKPKDLKNHQYLLLIVSTHGEGEAPDSIAAFHKYVLGNKAPNLENLQFAVFGLGDSSYEKFCQTAIEFDQRFEELGASRLLPRVDVDVAYEALAAKWTNDLVKVLSSNTNATDVVRPSGLEPTLALAIEEPTTYSKNQPFIGEVLASVNLNDARSAKQTHHIEIDLSDSGITYEAGDALGVWPLNRAEQVQQILSAISANGNEQVEVENKSISLYEALRTTFEINKIGVPLIQKLAPLFDDNTLNELLTDKIKLKEWALNKSLGDLFEGCRLKKGGVDFQWLIGQLRRISPRLYSISSSLNANSDEVHLTVAKVVYTTEDGKQQVGLCSNYLCKLEEGEKVAVYVHRNEKFRLPEDPSKPIIMIGPGTGIAPFRAFLQERAWQKATGKNWLFYGDRSLKYDFLYQKEILRWRDEGLLTKLDVAFSRDQEQKIYVQHKIEQQGAELWQWLLKGGYIYICGDAKYMAKDVHQSLLQLIEQHGNLGKAAAENYLETLRKNGRYQRDVY